MPITTDLATVQKLHATVQKERFVVELRSGALPDIGVYSIGTLSSGLDDRQDPPADLVSTRYTTHWTVEARTELGEIVLQAFSEGWL